MELLANAQDIVPKFKQTQEMMTYLVFIILRIILLEQQRMSEKSKVHVENTVPLVQFYKMAKKSGLKRTQYDPYTSPPNFEMAKKHGQANRVCLQSIHQPVTNYSEMEKAEICPCCNLPIQNTLIPLNANLRQLAHLGVTFPLYFQFIKKCASLLMIQFLLSSFYNLYLNYHGTTCQAGSFVCDSSVANVLQQGDVKFQFEGIANFMCLIVMIVAIEFFRVHQEIQRYGIEKHRITPADFTIQASGFRSEVRQEQIKEFLSVFYQTGELDLCGIYLLLDMGDYSNEYKKLLNTIKQINKIQARQRQNLSYNRNKLGLLLKEKVKLIDNLEQCEQQYQRFAYLTTQQQLGCSALSENIESNSFGDEIRIKFSGRVLVTFNRAQDSKRIVKHYKMTSMEAFFYWCYKRNIFRSFCKDKLSKFLYNDQILRIKRAAEPSDINWMNVGSNRMHQKFWISIWIIAIFSASCTFLSIFKLIVKNRSVSYEKWINFILSLGVSTVVALTNTLIGIIIRQFAGKETHKKQTNYFVSVGQRLSYLFFINMVLTTLGANLFFRIPQGMPNARLVAMLNDYFFLFITNTYLSSIFNYFDIVWGFRLLRRYFEVKKGYRSSLSQSEANQLFEGHPVDMALRYANVMKVMFFTAAVSPLLPIGLPLSIFGLGILFWVDKYLVLRRYVCKNYLDKQLANQMANILPNFAIFFSFGNLMTNFLMRFDSFPDVRSIKLTSSFYLALAGVAISVLYRYLVTIGDFKDFYQYVFNMRTPEKIIEGTFAQYKGEFIYLYEQFHPVLKGYQQSLNSSEQSEAQAPQFFQQIRISLQQQYDN